MIGQDDIEVLALVLVRDIETDSFHYKPSLLWGQQGDLQFSWLGQDIDVSRVDLLSLTVLNVFQDQNGVIALESYFIWSTVPDGDHSLALQVWSDPIGACQEECLVLGGNVDQAFFLWARLHSSISDQVDCDEQG
jgi:hypothetical protein